MEEADGENLVQGLKRQATSCRPSFASRECPRQAGCLDLVESPVMSTTKEVEEASTPAEEVMMMI